TQLLRQAHTQKEGTMCEAYCPCKKRLSIYETVMCQAETGEVENLRTGVEQKSRPFGAEY
ncbi:hypothetical protein, partial [Schinkia azotoformans]|uniref:hypothetical protein n=1 Tax=Schinkia azotoformans TaxID=1454 RepID=UPI002DC01A4F